MFNLFRKPLKAYWWREVPNFGDSFTPLLLEHFAYKKAEWAPISHASIIVIGSVLEHIPPLWDGYILGAGRLIENSRTNVIQMKTGISAKILALRGPLTARGIPGNYALGDPGILANELVGIQEKHWTHGILPHWSDNELVPRFKALIAPEYRVLVINPKDDPLTVLHQIGSCHKLVTSSLHGMIAADAFGIPRRVEICKQMAKEGGDFKFRDYSATKNRIQNRSCTRTQTWVC